ncbi:MAG: nucleotide sugar dehydrogenase [Puniceicoccales bacterium]|jgi:UDPglucose 6-dehydrogenase|nr:nucleotide sugar dehydrogenase [Puniceicoccales bacterium]
MRIACIGAGYVGGPTMAVIADKCPEIEVTVVDSNAERIAAWNNGPLPVYEPGLEAVVARVRGRNLHFSTDVDGAIRDAGMIFISVNTPTKGYGEGAGCAADLRFVEGCARQIAKIATTDKIVVEKSTLPVRTAELILGILTAERRAGVNFQVLSNPEFLAEGTAIANLESPDRVLVGSDKTPEGLAAAEKLIGIYTHWIERDKIFTSNVWSSELAKLTANAFLAQRISSINAISALCESTKANVADVAAAIGADARIGSKFLRASVGFGGSCFRKDILSLAYLCENDGHIEAANYWRSVVEMNEWQKRRFVRRIVRAFSNSMFGKRIALFGFAFKKDTDDTRESAAIAVALQLLEEKAVVAIHDPKVSPEQIRRALREASGAPAEEWESRVICAANPASAVRDAHAIVILTDWGEYSAQVLDYAALLRTMNRPAFLFDGTALLDLAEMRALGFSSFGIGRE